MVSWATPWILPPTNCMILAKSLKLKNKQTNKKKNTIASSMKLATQETLFRFLGQEDPMEKR